MELFESLDYDQKKEAYKFIQYILFRRKIVEFEDKYERNRKILIKRD